MTVQVFSVYLSSLSYSLCTCCPFKLAQATSEYGTPFFAYTHAVLKVIMCMSFCHDGPLHSGHQNEPLPLFTPGMKVHLLCPHRDLLCYPITPRPTQLCNITSSSTSSALVAQIVCFGLNTDTLLSAHYCRAKHLLF